MDYQGQNVNPNLTPDMGQNVAAPNNLETPDLPHDIQGMGAIGSSAANAEIEQMMSGDTIGQEKNREDGTIDLLSEMPPLSPTEMAETAAADPVGSAPVETKTVDTTSELPVKKIMQGDTISPEMAKEMDRVIDMADKDLAGFYEQATNMIEKTSEAVRGKVA